MDEKERKLFIFEEAQKIRGKIKGSFLFGVPVEDDADTLIVCAWLLGIQETIQTKTVEEIKDTVFQFFKG